MSDEDDDDLDRWYRGYKRFLDIVCTVALVACGVAALTVDPNIIGGSIGAVVMWGGFRLVFWLLDHAEGRA